MLLSVALAAALLPPVTQEEALEFHRSGQCSMGMQPGRGLTRADGRGWIVTMLPVRHRVWAVGGAVAIKGAPMGVIPAEAQNTPLAITVQPPGATVMWRLLTQTARIGHADEGRVPDALLYDAQTPESPLVSGAWTYTAALPGALP